MIFPKNPFVFGLRKKICLYQQIDFLNITLVYAKKYDSYTCEKIFNEYECWSTFLFEPQARGLFSRTY